MLRYLLALSIMIYLTYGILPEKIQCSPTRLNPLSGTSLSATSLSAISLHVPSLWGTPLSGTPLSGTPLPATSLPATSLSATSLDPSPLPDIVLGPGGVAGFYSLGISHYLLNHFDLKDKRLVGFSAGSFTLLFMRLSPEKRNGMLQEIFKCNEKSASNAMRHIMDKIETTTTLEDYDLNGSSIAVSHPGRIGLYEDFLTIQQLSRCCKSSSFIPFVTHESGIDFYNHKLAMDGFFYYNSFLKQYPDHPLVINPFMFGRYSNAAWDKIKFLFGIHPLKTTSIYQMYLYGYHDARQNHSFFEKYLKTLPIPIPMV